jgi:hypothetical protein
MAGYSTDSFAAAAEPDPYLLAPLERLSSESPKLRFGDWSHGRLKIPDADVSYEMDASLPSPAGT